MPMPLIKRWPEIASVTEWGDEGDGGGVGKRSSSDPHPPQMNFPPAMPPLSAWVQQRESPTEGGECNGLIS